MRTYLALLLVAVFAVFPRDGVAGEQQIVDVKELAGSWRGWAMREDAQEPATLIVSADGRSSRTTGTATLSEDQGKTMLTVMPENLIYKTGRAE